MDHEVDLAPQALDFGEGGIDGRAVGDVAMADDMGTKLGGQRTHALFKRIALIGEGEFGTGQARGPGDAPGNRTIVGDAHDEATLAGENSGLASSLRIDGLGHAGPETWEPLRPSPSLRHLPRYPSPFKRGGLLWQAPESSRVMPGEFSGPDITKPSEYELSLL